MGAPVFGPDDQWPRHSKAYWRSALEQARSAGWTLTYIDAPHRFGQVMCPIECHVVIVDSTARGGETKAKELVKHLHRCRHKNAALSRPEGRRRECLRLLDQAELLLDRVDHDLGLAEERHAAMVELERLEMVISTIEASVGQTLMEAQEVALQSAVRVDDAPSPAAVALALEEADSKAQEASRQARRLQIASGSGALRLRARAASERCSAARQRLTVLQVAMQDADG